jgi:hypothetical protein
MTDLLSSTKALLAINKDGAASHPLPTAAVECMAWCVAEIERLRFRQDRDAKLRDVNRRNWIEAAETAISLGDLRPLKLRVDLSKSGPIDFVETNDQR